ncbi:hypothetical protein GT346_28920, partial [Streptomyces sp. SID161]|nr:hypothetical protein [Streptomyces sp. SID161]
MNRVRDECAPRAGHERSGEPGPRAGHERSGDSAPRAGHERSGTEAPDRTAPMDLRLVPPALAAWGTAALTLDAPAAWTVTTAAACLTGGVLLLVLRR